MSDIITGVQGTINSEAEIFRRVSWGAIFSGVLVALSMELVFLSFGLFIGFQMTDGSATAWTKAWYLVGLFFSLLIGAWVAARLAGNPSKGNGMLHGFVVWGLTMFTTAVIAAALLWDVVRSGVSIVQTAIGTLPAAAASTNGAVPVNVSQVAANLANAISDASLVIFFGLLLALAGSLVGGTATPSGLTDLLGHRRHIREEHPRHA